MSRDSFLQIFWMFNVWDGPRRVDKIQGLVDALLANFHTAYYSTENVAVDETMVGFRGRFSAKQYMPNTPSKYGIKAFTLASSEHGYMLNILLYTGADTLLNADPVYSSLPQPARVVMQLMCLHLHKGHRTGTTQAYPLLRCWERQVPASQVS